MKSKRTYRSINVQQVKVPALLAALPSAQVLVGIDVAKTDMVAVFGQGQGEPVQRVRFEHPGQSLDFVAVLQAIKEAGKNVQVALEPTGTYGDALCYQMHRRGVDAAELFDGVPSQHDGKDATVVLRLHAQGLSKRWTPASEQRRELRAQVNRREMYEQMQSKLYNQMEALLVRHWPELPQLLPYRKRTTALRMLQEYPTAEQVQQQAQQVMEFVRQQSRGQVSAEVRKDLIRSAQQTLGVPPTPGEAELIADIARQVLALGEQLVQSDKRLRQLMAAHADSAKVVDKVGATTAAVFYALLGDLSSYSSAGTLEKACGLNLKEISSGKHDSPLHITKRGPGLVRKYLYLLAMRWIQHDLVARAWYQRRSSYHKDNKQPALIAVMRKLVSALWHLSKGDDYQASLLFDTRLLGLSDQGKAESSDETMKPGKTSEPTGGPVGLGTTTPSANAGAGR
jgi:transposase